MSGEEKNKLDELFKKGLDVPDTRFEYHEQDWDNFEQLMDAQSRPRRGIVYWLPILSGVAAVLLLFLGWWLFKPAPVTQQQQQVAVKHLPVQQPNTPDTSVVIANPANGNNIANNGGGKTNAGSLNNEHENKPVVSNKQYTAPVYANATVLNSKSAGNNTSTANYGAIDQGFAPANGRRQQEILAAVEVKRINSPANKVQNDEALINTNMANSTASFNAERTRQELILAENSSDKIKRKPTLSYSKGPQLGLAMLVSPDINGAGSFQNAKVGTNIGLLFSVGVGKRLTFSTGAAYSKKPYMTDFSNYHTGYQFKTDPTDVYADCRVLDIPVNVDYKLYSKNRNAFSIGSGLSSYIMLKEKYTYDYAVAGTVGPASFTVTNKNRHILGVLNLNATYAHQLNSKFSIAAQPYLKIPLTDIGNSQVRLQSAGVAVGLRWNINQ